MAPPERAPSTPCLVAAAMVLLAGLVAWRSLPALQSTSYWASHFPTVDPRLVLLAAVPLGVLAALAPLVWPGTREAVHLTRSARALTGGTLLYWALAVILDAPRLGAYAILPVLIAPTLGTVGVLLKTRLPLRGPLIAAAGTLATALLAVLLLAHVARTPLRDLTLVLLATPYLATVPWTLRDLRARTLDPDLRDPSGTRWRGTREDPHPLDLPAGMQSPGPGLFGLALTVAALLFIAFIVAPGVPLTTFVRWTALALLLPVLLRGVVRRPGVAHSDALVGPPTLRMHHAQVAHLPDARLTSLDGPLEHWLRTGRGHRVLARALAGVLAPVIPEADEVRVGDALARMPRGRRHRGRREDQLAHFLGAPPTTTRPAPRSALRRLIGRTARPAERPAGTAPSEGEA